MKSRVEKGGRVGWLRQPEKWLGFGHPLNIALIEFSDGVEGGVGEKGRDQYLAQATGKVKLPLIDVGKVVGGSGLGRK